MKGMAGGLLGGALGGMLFGSLFGGGGMGGSGIGILQILIFGGIFYFIFKKFNPNKGNKPSFSSYQQQDEDEEYQEDDSLDGGIAQIRQSEPDFDPKYFTEVAQDVFFKVQAGWMRRDVDSYRNLLGEQLAREYEEQFAEMKSKGEINKLESIAVRSVEVIDAGVDGSEEFVAVRFVASLLDYTVNEESGDIIKGSNSEPVKFDEKWIWARSIGSQNWILEGIE